MTDRNDLKREAAEQAADMVESGMIVGLGTGSTAAFFIDALIARTKAGLSILGIPTSERSAAQARAGGIKLTGFDTHTSIDICVDGADEIKRDSLDLVKGLGGALLREKIVAAASDRLVIIADRSKLVERLGGTTRIPVEVVTFGWQTTEDRIARLGGQPVLRRAKDGTPFHTDGGNLILDCAFGELPDAQAVERALSETIGVVETGLFIGMATTALVASAEGVRRLDRA